MTRSIELETRGTGTTFDELVTVGQVGDSPYHYLHHPNKQTSSDYLDHADELINRYISAKERLIAPDWKSSAKPSSTNSSREG